MKQKLFDPDREPKCKYCEFGTETTNGVRVLCLKSGLHDPDDFCRKFRYDPLKRVPDPHPPEQVFTADEFKV